MRFEYELIVDETEDGWTAALDDVTSPLRGFGSSPLQAIAALAETLREWPITGANKWLMTNDGVKLARQFVPDFEPRGKGGQA